MQKKDKGKVMIEEYISNDCAISETFDKFSTNIVLNLKITSSKNFEASIEFETKIQWRTQ